MEELFRYFLRLGATGFGGPIALIGLMEKHFVRKTKSITDVDFQRYVASAKLFPGPLATLIAVRIGHASHGWKGGMLAGIGLILPAFLMIIALSEFFFQSRTTPSVIWSALITGLNLGGLTLSAMAAFRFARPLVSPNTAFYFLISGILTYLHPSHEIYFLIGCGILSLLHHRFKHLVFEGASIFLIPLFLESLKASLFTFGSGIAIVPALKAAYLDQHHWVTNNDFLTSLSLGQMTPGPLVIFNASLGHQVAGISGAIFASLGTFLPTFVFGILLMPVFERKLLQAPLLKTFFAGMLPAVGGAIIGSVIRLCLYAFENGDAGIDSIRILMFIFLLALGLIKDPHSLIIILSGGVLAVGASLAGIIQ